MDQSTQVSAAVAQLLASAVRDASHRDRVSEWSPIVERTVETKGKRGWEKRDPTKSPSRLGGWIARTLSTLLHRKDVKVRVFSLRE